MELGNPYPEKAPSERVDFPPFDLLEWFIRWLPGAEYDIGSSGMAGATLEEAGVEFHPSDVAEVYPGGDPEFRQALAESYGVSAREVIVTAGTSEANFLACGATLSVGDTAAIEHPTYTPLRNLPLGFGAKTVAVRRHERAGFHLDPSSLADVDNFQLFIMANPNNPSGTVEGERTMREVGEVCADSSAWAIVDEVFLGLVFRDAPPSAATLGERFIVTSGLTKLYGLGGLRIGWAVGPQDIIERMERLSHHVSAAPSHVSERVAMAAMERESYFIERARKILDETKPLVEDWIRDNERVSWIPPDIGNFGYPRVEGVDVTALAELLAEEYKTVIAPGEFFGHRDHFRLGFGMGREHVEGGLSNLGKALDKF